MDKREQPGGDHGEEGHGFGGAGNRAAEFRPDKIEHSGNEAAGHRHRDPEYVVCNIDTPPDRVVDPGDTHTRLYLVDPGAKCRHARDRPQPRTARTPGHRAAERPIRFARARSRWPAGRANDRPGGGDGAIALINPGAGWPSKLWPAERFAAVAEYLGRVHGLLSIVVWAGDQEQAWARQIVTGSAGWARSRRPPLLSNWRRWRCAELFVSSDTGPLHLAAAVGTPCVGLFGPMPGERNGPYGPRHITIQAARLAGSSRQRRSADNATMLAIDVGAWPRHVIRFLAVGRIARRGESADRHSPRPRSPDRWSLGMPI